MERLDLKTLQQCRIYPLRSGDLLKLNVGCGRNYKKGYINIDAFDNTIADQMMTVESMDFEDNTFSQVDCIQVLEHLGAARSIYALAEIYRVMSPEGILLLQTPDLVNSFKSFIKGNEDRRRLIMNWIFGLDSPGLFHRYGFPAELLQLVLHESGFEQIEIDYINTHSVNPTIQARCRKGNSRIYQSISHFRKKLVSEKLIDLQQQIEVLEIETLIQELLKIIRDSKATLEETHLRRIVQTSATCSPKIGLVFLETISDSVTVEVKMVQKHIEVLRELDGIGFARVLVHLFWEMPILHERQSDTLQSLKSIVGKVVEKLLIGNRKTSENLAHTASQVRSWIENSYFSETMLEMLSERMLALGVKAFALNQLEEAENRFIDAIRLNRDSVLPRWNLARVYALMGRTEKSLRCYESLREYLVIQYLRQSKHYIKRIESEVHSVRLGNMKVIANPVHSMP